MAICGAEGTTRPTEQQGQVLDDQPVTSGDQAVPQHDRVDIMGIMVDRTTQEQVFADVELYIASGRPHQIVTVNVDFINISERDPGFITLLNAAALSVPDGMPLLWISRLLKAALPERITGTDLLLGAAELAASRGYRIFLLGAAEGVAAEAATLLETRYPGLKIAGTYSPPHSATFDPEEDERMVQAVIDAQPDILFAALGTPKQEKWIARHLDRMNVPVSVGVGGVFNFITGRVPRAPLWMQRAGLEWLFRLICEPRRLWRRYLLEDTRALYKALIYTARGGRATSAARRSEAYRTQPIPIVPLPTMTTNAMSVGETEWHLITTENTRPHTPVQLPE